MSWTGTRPLEAAKVALGFAATGQLKEAKAAVDALHATIERGVLVEEETVSDSDRSRG